MADRGSDRTAVRNIGGEHHAGSAGDKPAPGGAATDAGRTSGGGNLGHEQPAEVEETTNIRNNAGHRDDAARPKQGS